MSYTVQPTPEHSQVALLNFAKAKFKGTQAAGAHLWLTFLCAQKGESPAGAKSRHLREAQKSLTKSADTLCFACDTAVGSPLQAKSAERQLEKPTTPSARSADFSAVDADARRIGCKNAASRTAYSATTAVPLAETISMPLSWPSTW